MNLDINQPFADLDPNLILTAIESVGYACSGSLLALNSYENRVYQVGLEDQTFIIAKFYRPHRWTDAAILEEHQFSLDLTEHEIPVIAPLITNKQTLHFYNHYRFAVFPRRGGRALEVDNLAQLEWMGRFIGRLHAVGACKAYEHRPQLDIQTHGYTPYQYLINNQFIPDYLKPEYCKTVETLLQLIQDSFTKVGPIKYIRLHGDCHLGNVLWNDVGPHIVDLDDSVMGPAVQDIWMLLSSDYEQFPAQINAILDGYLEFMDFNYRELQLIEAMRSLRMIQYSAWLAVRWEDPAFPRAFPWFNTPHYWQEQVRNLTNQIYSLTKSDDHESYD